MFVQPKCRLAQDRQSGHHPSARPPSIKDGLPAASASFRAKADGVLAQRNPMLLLRLSGLLLLRYGHAALSWLLFHEPPRSTILTAAPKHGAR